MFRRAVFVIAVVVAAVAASLVVAFDVDAEFANFKVKFHREYSTPAEEARRRAIFAENFASLVKLQAQFPGEYGITELADYSRAERRRMLISQSSMSRHNNASRAKPSSAPPAGLNIHAVEQDKLGAVPTAYLSPQRTSVKSQGQCGSCWAFTVSALAEARWMRSYSARFPTGGYSITPQQLVSCWQKSCEGSYIDDAAQWLQNRYTNKWDSWPYASSYGTVPACKTATSAFKPTWAQVLPQTNKANISGSIYYREAVSIAIGVCPDFYDYSPSSTRVYTCRCSKAQYDGYHAMTLVGYNFTGSTQYWIIKNSWGVWGRDPASTGSTGYLFLADGTCSMYDNVNTFVTFWP